jgi:hypothetical protein
LLCYRPRPQTPSWLVLKSTRRSRAGLDRGILAFSFAAETSRRNRACARYVVLRGLPVLGFRYGPHDLHWATSVAQYRCGQFSRRNRVIAETRCEPTTRKSAVLVLARSRMTVLGSPANVAPVAGYLFAQSWPTAHCMTCSASRMDSCAASDVVHRCDAWTTLTTSNESQ